MENEHKTNGHQMCDWCGNEYGHKYKWWRLALAVLIGLFIFLAGIEIGQMRMNVYSQPTTYRAMHRGGWNRGVDVQYGQQAGTTTMMVVPADTQGQNVNGPMIPAGAPTPTSTAPAGAVTH